LDKQAVESHIKEQFESLPRVLQKAARYAMEHPTEIALESMRSVAAKAGLQSAAMFRLARHLGFDSYESFRDCYRAWLVERDSPFSNRAGALRRVPRGNANAVLIGDLLDSDLANLSKTLSVDQYEQLTAASTVLMKARRIYVLGLRSLFPAAYYFNYVCSMFCDDTVLLSGTGGIIADQLRRIDSKDVLLAFSVHPYAADALKMVKFARERDARIIGVTDSVLSPIAPAADIVLTLSNSTPSLFPSVVPALAVSQALAALLVANGSKKSLAEIRNSESLLSRFGVYVREP